MAILPTANTVFHHRGQLCPRLRKRRMNTLGDTFKKSHSGFHRHYTQMSAKFLILHTKKAQVSSMCFIILNDLYIAHHNSLGMCHHLKIRHLYGTFNFSTQCICTGTGSLSVVFVERRALYEGAPYLR